MYKTITKWDFISEFQRSDRKHQFSFNALCTIFDHIEMWESENKQTRFCLVDICVQYEEFANLEEFNNSNDYGYTSLDETPYKSVEQMIEEGNRVIPISYKYEGCHKIIDSFILNEY
jgi:hypothetical protein